MVPSDESKTELKNDLKIAVCPMTSVDDWVANIQDVEKTVNSITESIDLFCFPENALYMRLSEGAPLDAIDLKDTRLDILSGLAKAKKTAIHLGSIPVMIKGKATNSSVLIQIDGSRTAVYTKMHLFDVEIVGHRSYRESDSVSHGDSPRVILVKGWHLGQSICYDLRFSELYSVYAKQGVEAIMVPSAFTVPTGDAHWHVLLRARAIESQCYVIAPAQGGNHKGKRETYGHSLVVDPWGRILAEDKGDGKPLIVALKPSELKKVREQIPMANHRRF